jgi:hypothetical protein
MNPMNIRSLSRSPHYVENQVTLDSLIPDAVRVYLEAGLSRDHDLRNFYSALGFALLYNRDLGCILEDIETPPTAGHANLYGRMVVLLADELFAKLPVVMGKEFRALLRRWNVPEVLRDELAGCQQGFRALKRSEAGWCEELRDNTIAHRDISFGKQWRLIAQFDVRRANELAAKLLEWTNTLYRVLNGILVHQVTVRRAAKTA